MNLQSIINGYETGALLDQPDPVLERARLEIEAAATQARHLPTLAPFRQMLYDIELGIQRALILRYGCND